MVAVKSRSGANKLTILGHGLMIPERFELEAGIHVEPTCPQPNLEDAAQSCENFSDYAAVVTGAGIATFSLEVFDAVDVASLLTKAWNSLWTFHLLSLACEAPCFPLYTISVGDKVVYSAANRNLVARPLPKQAIVTVDQLKWAKSHTAVFSELVACPEFNAAMRCYGNSHYLFDLDVRIMLIWAGIEGLLSVDSELSRRLALYAAIMLEGTSEEKAAYLKEVKDAYGIRSRAVHGGKIGSGKLQQGYVAASRILARLLARCVEIGRVPTPAELDRLAASPTVR
jgi:hypothetical protein